MKKSLILLGVLAMGYTYAQEGKVGINTESPTGTLTVKTKTTASTTSATSNLILQNGAGTEIFNVKDDGSVLINKLFNTPGNATNDKIVVVSSNGTLKVVSKNDIAAAGTAGADGKSILNGTGVPANTIGKEGEFYIDTQNKTIYGPKTSTGWGNPTSLVGERGSQGPAGATGAAGTAGANGKSVLNGTSAPATTIGTVGDFYINTTAKTIYGPKTNAGWGNPTSLVGPQGPAGANGTPGATGATGATGPAGATGAAGKGISKIERVAGSNQLKITYTDNTSVNVDFPADQNTTYTAGTGLTLTGTTFSANPAEISLAGDVTGNADANTVTKIQGKAVSAAAPTDNQVLQWKNNAWTPATISTGGSTPGAYIVPTASFKVLETETEYNVGDDDYYISVNGPTAQVTITLPAAASAKGRVLVITNKTSGNVVLNDAGRQAINGSEAPSINKKGTGMTIISDGTSWYNLINY